MLNLEILTWNVHEGRRHSDGLPFAFLDHLSIADVVCLQEVPEADVDRLLNSGWNAACRMVEPSTASPGKEMGLAILSRHRLSNVSFQIFPEPSWYVAHERGISLHPKGALVASIDGLDGRITVANVHLLPPYIFAIPESSSAALGYLESVADCLVSSYRPTIIAGDFNNTNRMICFGRRGYASASRSYSTRNSGESHDDILLDSTLVSSDISVFPGDSDHHAVLVKATLNPKVGSR